MGNSNTISDLRVQFNELLASGYPNSFLAQKILDQVTGSEDLGAPGLEFDLRAKLSAWDRDDRATIAMKNGSMGEYNEILNGE